MDEISWFSDAYSDTVSLEFDTLFSTIDFESFESKETDSATEVNNTSNTTNTASERTCPHRDNFGNKQLTSAGRGPGFLRPLMKHYQKLLRAPFFRDRVRGGT